MKTILVIYSCTRLSKGDAQTMKRYSFNTSTKVKVGDRFISDRYETPMQVVEVMPVKYQFVDVHSGELSNKRKASTKQSEIRELKISAPSEVHGMVEAVRLED